MSCSADEPWGIVLEDIDTAAVGNAFTAGESVEVLISKSEDPAQYNAALQQTPDITYGGEMYGNWDFSLDLSLDIVDGLAQMQQISIVGTGVKRTLPAKDMKELLTKFRSICSGFGNGTEHMD